MKVESRERDPEVEELEPRSVDLCIRNVVSSRLKDGVWKVEGSGWKVID